MGRIGFLGGGNMAEALVKGVIAAGLYGAEDVIVSDIRPDRLDYLNEKYDVSVTDDNDHLVQGADIVVLSVKPQVMAEVLADLKPEFFAGKLVVSIMAGKRIADIAKYVGQTAIVRVMPNTPALVGQGASGIFANDKAHARLDEVISIFSAVGEAVVIADETLMDAVTAVSGSGPAYYFLLEEEMIKAGVELGLDEDVATKLVLQTAKGAAMLACDSQDAPGILREKVTSPGGTTAAALEQFKQGGFEQLVNKALTAARDRGREL